MELKFYRYELVTYASMGDSDVAYNTLSAQVKLFSNSRLVLSEYNLYKETPKGYWIGYRYSKRWISKTGKKRYAYPTKKEALINYIKRTERRKEILENQAFACQLGINSAKNMLENL